MVAKILWQVWHLTAQVLNWIDLTPIEPEWMAPTAKPSSMWPLRNRWTLLIQHSWVFVIYLVPGMHQFQKFFLQIHKELYQTQYCITLRVILWYSFLRFYPSKKFSIILMILLNYLPAEHSKFSDLENVLMRRNSKTTVASLNPK